jgi:hypothetical protein
MGCARLASADFCALSRRVAEIRSTFVRQALVPSRALRRFWKKASEGFDSAVPSFYI